ARADLVLSKFDVAHAHLYKKEFKERIKEFLKSEDILIDSTKKVDSLFIKLAEDYVYGDKLNISSNFNKSPEEVKQKSWVKNKSEILAQEAVKIDKKLISFRNRIEQFKKKKDFETLECILDATEDVYEHHKMPVRSFLNVFSILDDETLKDYSELVSKLYHKESNALGISNLADKIISNYDYSVLSKAKLVFNNYGFLENENNDENKMSDFAEELDNNPNYKNIFQKLSNKLKIFTSSSKTGDIDKKTVFETINKIKKIYGNSTTREWIKACNELIDINFDSGEKFCLDSFDVLEVYKDRFDWDVDKLAKDFNNMGYSLLRLSYFVTNNNKISKKRLKNLLDEIIENKDSSSLNSLINLSLNKLNLRSIEKAIPDNSTNKEFLDALYKANELTEINFDKGTEYRTLLCYELDNLKENLSLEDYFKVISGIEFQLKDFIEFKKEIEKDNDLKIGFSDNLAQKTIIFYKKFLDKELYHFKRDYRKLGSSLQRIPKLKNDYFYFFEENEFKKMINYVIKSKNRELIKDLVNINKDDVKVNRLYQKIFSRLTSERNVENDVKLFQKTNQLISFLEEATKNENVFDYTNKLVESKEFTYDDYFEKINDIKKEFYKKVVGDRVIPKEFEDVMNHIVIGHSKLGHEIKIRNALEMMVSNYLDSGEEKTFELLRNLENNKEIRSFYENKGIDVDVFEKGIKRSYDVKTNDDFFTKIEERRQKEINQAYQCLSQLISEEEIEEIKNKPSRKQFREIQKVINNYEFDISNAFLKSEIEGHLNTARSLSGDFKSKDSKIDFYVSTDVIESLQMGQFFNSCLSLSKNHNGCNGWASIVQTYNSNMNVIYARDEQGNYIGRNRTVLTNQGILTTQFYENGTLNLEDSWISYLTDFANAVGSDVILPKTFIFKNMASKLDKLVEEGKAYSEDQFKMSVKCPEIGPFFTDGLIIDNIYENDFRDHQDISCDVYVIKHSY
ncbi:hypothetical protein KY334_01460, partial [Candidatus Woesearchaeota archaeon]|nr:hypothetical protein [Candidatus Woesearchaeota archaeon]